MKTRAGLWVIALIGQAVGCGGDARVELSAAQSIEALAGGLETALKEYHDETETADDRREDSVIGAFVARVHAAAGDEAATAQSVEDFTAALRKVRTDRRVEWQRHTDALDNVAVLREVTGGLRQLAIDSLTLSDEVRRYLQTLVQQTHTPRPAPRAVSSQSQ